jgi:hypothetical protein
MTGIDSRFASNHEPESSTSQAPVHPVQVNVNADITEDLGEGMDPQGFLSSPLTREALTAYKAAQDRAGVIYISRIPPGMQPAKVRHFMSAYGEIGRIYLQPEGSCSSPIRTLLTGHQMLKPPTCGESLPLQKRYILPRDGSNSRTRRWRGLSPRCSMHSPSGVRKGLDGEMTFGR